MAFVPGAPASNVPFYEVHSSLHAVGLTAALSEVVAYVAFRDLFGPNWWVVGFHIAAMTIYVVIAWRITQVREE